MRAVFYSTIHLAINIATATIIALAHKKRADVITTPALRRI